MNLDDIKNKALKSINDENNKVFELINKYEINNDLYNKVIDSNCNELKKMIFNKKVTVFEIVIIHWKQNFKYKYLNCVTEYCYNHAFKKSKKLDKELINYKYFEDLPAFFEIPFSAKDSESQNGYFSTIGLKSECKQRQDYNGLTVNFVNNLGGIIIVRGNIPQLLFIPETVNNIFGRSYNLYNQKRTVGGSSGGDCGILSYKGCKISLTSDIAGSTRIPALFCGVIGFKPTSIRFRGKFNDKKSSDISTKYIFGTKGPASNSLEDIKLYVKTTFENYIIFNKEKINSQLKFNNIIYNKYLNKKLKIGYIGSIDNFIGISEPNKNVYNESLEKLKYKHDIKEFKIKEIIEELCYHYISQNSQNFKNRINKLNGESCLEEFKLINLSNRLPVIITKLLINIFNSIGEIRKSKMIKNTLKMNNNKLNKLSNRTLLLIHKFNESWRKENFDCIIIPGMSFPALLHGQSKLISPGVIPYTSVYNILDIPMITLPIRFVKKNEEIYNEKVYINDSVSKEINKCMINSEGLPIGIQIATLRCEEEKLLSITNQINHFVN